MPETAALVPGSPSSPVIRALETWGFFDEQLGYARSQRTGESQFLTPFEARLALGCRSFEPAAVHVARYLAPFKGMERVRLWRAVLRQQLESGGQVQVAGLLQRVAEEALASLRSKGILQDRAAFAASLAEAVGEAPRVPPITTVGIPTAQRPEILQRALDSYLPHFKAQGRDVRVLVSDDSRDAAVASQNQQVAREAQQRHQAKVEYLGAAERRRLIEEHAQGSAERRRALEFLLVDEQGLGQTFGMPRNALLLAARGELLLCVDDDTLCRVCTSPTRRAGLELWEGTGGSPPALEHPSRASALAAVRPYEGDLLAGHEAFLGRSTAAALLGQTREGDFTVGALGPRGAKRLLRHRDRVALTVNGLVGDSGSTTSPVSALTYLPPAQVRAALASGQDLLQGVSSREVVKVLDWARNVSGDNFMTTFYGHDNREWTVPFFPYLRGEDQLFKEMLIRVDPAAEVVYLPWALEHAPVSNNRPKPPLVLLFDMFLAAIGEVPRPADGASVKDRTRELGHLLVSFADQPPALFRRRVFEVVAGFTLNEVSRHRRFLKDHGASLPGPVAEAVTSALQRLEGFLSAKDWVCAEDAWVEKAGSAQAAEELSRAMIRRMGEATVTLAG